MSASGIVSREGPAHRLSGRTTQGATSSAASVSVSVAPPFSMMIRPIGWPSVIVVPNWRRTTSHRYSTYCVSIGLSKPSSCWRRASSSGGSLPPSVAEMGSPGATRIIRNTTVNSTQTMGTISARRTRMYPRSDPALDIRSFLALLRDQPEAQLEGGVERLLHALHAVLDGGDLLALPDRDQRHVLGLGVLDDPEGLRALCLVVGLELGVERVIDLLRRVAVLEEAAVAHERREVVVAVRIVREPAQPIEVVLVLGE